MPYPHLLDLWRPPGVELVFGSERCRSSARELAVLIHYFRPSCNLVDSIVYIFI
jgi:hypothetical protein